MQSSTSLQENRVVTVLRWIARVLGVVAALVLGLWVWVSFSEGTSFRIDPTQWALWAILGAGLLLAVVGSIVWKGISEVVGGLLIVGAALWITINGGFEAGAVVAGALCALPGVLFIICGGYTLTRRSVHATGATA